MSAFCITCDRQDKLLRATVWQDDCLRDLYLDRMDKPDLTGAIVSGKIIRVLPKQKGAYLDCALGEHVYVENCPQYSIGDYLTAKITRSARQGKAWGGVVHKTEVAGSIMGILVEPPAAWQRAITGLKNTKIRSIKFADRDAYKKCQEWLTATNSPHANLIELSLKEQVHPALDEILEQLQDSTIPISGGGEIIVQQTEALVAIDVNSGENSNVLAVNLSAVKEIARQIRLRNLSGIIIIDAMKMKERTDKSKVLNALTKAVSSDVVNVAVFGFTKLGLIEMTRTRQGLSFGEMMNGL